MSPGPDLDRSVKSKFCQCLCQQLAFPVRRTPVQLGQLGQVGIPSGGGGMAQALKESIRGRIQHNNNLKIRALMHHVFVSIMTH
jgi:hypothetical protein